MAPAVTEETINQAAEILKQGGVIVFPTDTAYGVGGDYQNQETISRILELKGRTDKKFTLVAASIEQVEEFFTLEGIAREYARQYWPGPLSIVVDEQFSIRVPDNEIIKAIAEAYGKPIIATSANKTGAEPPYTIEEAKQQLGKENVDLWIDGGPLEHRPVSTVIRITEGRLECIREGAIKIVAQDPGV